MALVGREPEIPLIFQPRLMEPNGDAVLTSTGNTLSFLLGPVTVALSRHEFGLDPVDLHRHDIVVKRTQITLDGEAVWTLP